MRVRRRGRGQVYMLAITVLKQIAAASLIEIAKKFFCSKFRVGGGRVPLAHTPKSGAAEALSIIQKILTLDSY